MPRPNQSQACGQHHQATIYLYLNFWVSAEVPASPCVLMTAYHGQTGMLREVLFTSTAQQPKATDGVGRMMEERRDGVPRYFTGMVAYGVGGALTLCQGFCMPI